MTNPIKLATVLLFVASHSFLFAAPGDVDNDGLRDAVETSTGVFTSPNNTGTNPLVADSDGDSMPDGMEVSQGTNPTSAASNIKRPNIILINCDDLGYGDIGCFWQNQRTGTRKFATPNLDEMAAQGAMMTDHYVGAPICAPSRASLMQGRHQGHSDIRDRMFDVPLPNNHSIASVLKASGYRTVHVGKAGLAGNEGQSGVGIPPAHPLLRGFDRYFGYISHFQAHEHYPRNGQTAAAAFIYNDYKKVTDANQDLYTSDAWTGFAKKTIIEETTSNPNRPFFLYVAYDTPHFIAQVPPTRDYPANRGLSGGIQWTGAPSYVNTAVNDAARIDNLTNMHPSVNPTWPVLHQKYATMIRRLDDSLADILQTLRDLNIADNTLVIFTSDNGPDSLELDPQFFQSYAGFEGMKQIIYEGGIRVPTIAWWPGKIPASNQLSNIRRIANPSANYDWLATFAEMALAPVPSYTDGASLLPDLTGQGSRNAKDYLYFEFASSGYLPNWTDWPNHRNELIGQMQAIRIGNFMGVRPNITTGTEAFRIYNVVSDPKQGIDLAANRTDLQERMKYLSIAARRPTESPTVTSAIRPYDNTLIPAQSARPVRNGVKWKAYEGYWPWLPEFRNLIPVSSGEGPNLSTSVLSRATDAGATFEAYFSVPTTGAYTFQLAANSNCNLWIDEAHVIDNDYNFTTTKTATKLIYLTAGLHPIRIYYRHQSGTAALELKYSGPGISLQTVPASSLFIDGPPPVFNLQADTGITKINKSVLVDALANDSSNYPITLASTSSAGFGTATIDTGKILYNPPSGFFGSTTLPYTVSTGSAKATSTVTAHILIDNESWIPMNEGSGTGVQSVQPTGLGTGTLLGTTNPGASWIPGKSGACLTFDGIDDEVDFPGLTLPTGTSPRTLICWVRSSATATNELQTIFSYGNDAPGERFSARLDNTPGVAANHSIRLEVDGGYIVGTRTINDGQWHHLAWVVSDADNDTSLNVDETLLYVDGIADPVSASSSKVINTGSSFTPTLGGSSHASNCNFMGDIDDVRIFPRVLSAAEINSLGAPPAMLPPADGDSDGDGATDLQEFIAGTNPQDPSSYFRIDTFTRSDSGISLQWTGVAGRTYRVEESTELSAWTSVPGIAPVIVTSQQPAASVAVPANGLSKRFLRIQVMQTP